VIGVPDEAQIERVKAVVVLKDPTQESEATAQALIDFCRERLIKWSRPREIEFRRELPKTLIGKIDYKVLVPNTSKGQPNERRRALRAHGLRFMFTVRRPHFADPRRRSST
jgi:acyl-coenzyme A synthetase/AMP-(fatty) acid ligase